MVSKIRSVSAAVARSRWRTRLCMAIRAAIRHGILAGMACTTPRRQTCCLQDLLCTVRFLTLHFRLPKLVVRDWKTSQDFKQGLPNYYWEWHIFNSSLVSPIPFDLIKNVVSKQCKAFTCKLGIFFFFN